MPPPNLERCGIDEMQLGDGRNLHFRAQQTWFQITSQPPGQTTSPFQFSISEFQYPYGCKEFTA